MSDSSAQPAEVDETTAQLNAISELRGAQRKRAIASFHEAHQDLYEKFGNSLSRHFGVPFTYREDVLQEVVILGVETVNSWTPGQAYRWEVSLWFAANSRIRSLVESGHWDGVAGMTTRHRRASKLRRQRDRLRRIYNSEPTAQEIVDAHNQDAQRRYSDPKRQGMIATVDDLANINPLSLSGSPVGSDDEDTTMDVPVMDLTDECALSPIESPDFVAKLIDECYARSSTLGDVASGWLGGFGDDGAPMRSAPELAEWLGRSYESTRRNLIKVKEVAVELLARDYGIFGMDDHN